MKCSSCQYERTDKGCETPGCMESIHMPDEVRAMRKRESEEREERERIQRIRSAMYAKGY